MGWLFQVLQLVALPGSDVSIEKLMSVIHSLFIYPLVTYAQCFFTECQEGGSSHGFLAVGFANRFSYLVSTQCQEGDWGIHSLGN